MAGKVLVVDDQPKIVELIADALTGAGYEVCSARDGQAGLDLIATETPDLLILDLNIPVLPGVEVLRKLRSQPETQHLPVIVLTGRAEQGDMLDCWMGGADRYLTKPCSMKELINTVAGMLLGSVTPGRKNDNASRPGNDA